MLDTISRRTSRHLLPHVVTAMSQGHLLTTPGWKFQITNNGTTMPGVPSTLKLTGNHEETGLYIYGTTSTIEGWTVSLPGVLHGFNGNQLKTDKEIAQSLVDVNSILNQISLPPRLGEPVRRLDVACNISHPEPERIVLALKHARHPSIRRATEQYAHGSIRFPGTESVFTAYWKRAPKRSGVKSNAWHTSKVLRLELQLKKEARIAEFLDLHESTIDHLPPIDTLYQKFRAFMLGFPRSEQIAGPCTMAGLLSLCESQDVRLPGGETVMDWHHRSVTPSGYSKMRRQVAGLTAQFLSIDWAELLPADHFPETVDVHIDGTTTIIPSRPLTPIVKQPSFRLGSVTPTGLN